MAVWSIEPRNPIERIAAHEAGHAVVAWHTRSVLEFRGVYLRHSAFDGNAATLYRFVHHPPLSFWEITAIKFGGMAGVLVGLNDFSMEGAQTDLESAVAEVQALVHLHPDTECPWRLPKKQRGPVVEVSVDGRENDRINAVLAACFTHARRTIMRNRAMFTQLIGELVCRKRLTGRQLEKLFGAREWVLTPEELKNP